MVFFWCLMAVVWGMWPSVSALGQECPQGCISPDELTEECLPALPDICPIQIFNSTSACVSWLNDNGTWANHVQHDATKIGCWQTEPFAGGTSPYAATDFTWPMIGEGTASGSGEWSCAIKTDGTLTCFGAGGIENIPTGEGPYSALSSSSSGTTTVRAGVLTVTGAIRIWGNTAGAFGTSVPTTTGFTELGVGYAVGCAAGISNGGVTCWGDNFEGLVTHASKPTTGTYIQVEVARYLAAAVRDDNTLAMWGTTRAASGKVTLAQTLVNNRPTSGVRWVELGDEILGVATHTDGTASIWIPDGVGVPAQMTNAPGWSEGYGNNSLKIYKPQGPNGEITFRGKLEIVGASNNPFICGVIDDPKGLPNDNPLDADSLYNHGDAICWPNTTDGYPRVEAQCVPQYW